MLSVIVVNFNTRKCLKTCLESLERSLQEKHEIIVVDNASNDGSVQLIRSKFPEVKLISLEENVGFGAANNRGMNNAQGDIFWLLNPDTELLSSPTTVLDFMENNQVDIVGTRLEDAGGSTQSFTCGCFYNVFTPLKRPFHFLGSCWEIKEPMEVDWVTGASMFITREVYQALHGFDESYFMYFEDQDLCYRAKQLGFKVYYYPLFSVKHMVGQSFRQRKKHMKSLYYESLRLFYKKTRSPLEAKLASLLLDSWEAFYYKFL